MRLTHFRMQRTLRDIFSATITPILKTNESPPKIINGRHQTRQNLAINDWISYVSNTMRQNSMGLSEIRSGRNCVVVTQSFWDGNIHYTGVLQRPLNAQQMHHISGMCINAPQNNVSKMLHKYCTKLHLPLQNCDETSNVCKITSQIK